MVLYYYVSLKSFVEMWEEKSGATSSFMLPAIELMHRVQEEEVEYGLSVLRESIGLYEEQNHIPVELSKKEMPFYRQDSRSLVGPEMGMYIVPLYERPDLSFPCEGPGLVLELDYSALGEHCLFENLFLLRCKYNRKPVVEEFLVKLETEYDKFFFDEEHTGFTADSRFFSMLCNACMEVRDPALEPEKEWRLAGLKSPDEVVYRYMQEDLLPYFPISLPADCLKRIYLRDLKEHPLLHGTLINFLKSKGLPTEQLLGLS